MSYKTTSDVLFETPLNLMKEAVSNCTEVGSSTCSIVMVDKKKGKIYGATLGDSLYLIARFDGLQFQLKFISEEQSHAFNTPFQLGKGCDDPSKSLCYEHSVENKDVIVVASDG